MAIQKHASPKNGFTPGFLDNIKPKDKRVEYRDALAAGSQ